MPAINMLYNYAMTLTSAVSYMGIHCKFTYTIFYTYGL